MKKLLLLLCTLLGTAGAWAEVLNFTPGDGSYGATSGWKNTLTFSSSPVLTVTASANNMDAAQVSDFWDWRSGGAKSSTYTLSVASGVIKSYKITAEALSDDQTLTARNKTITITNSASADFEVTGLNSPKASFILSGENTGLKVTAISVTVGDAVIQPTLTTDANNPIYYTIKNYRSNNYAFYTGVSSQLGQKNSITSASLWYFMANDDGVSIINAANPAVKLVSYDSFNETGNVWYLVKNPYREDCVCVSLKSDATSNCWDDQGGHATIGFWQPAANDNEGTSWNIEETNYTYTSVQAMIAEEQATNLVPVFNEGTYVYVGEKVSNFTTVTDRTDNSHWYILTQIRGGETPMYDVGKGNTLKRAETSITTATINSAPVSDKTQYLIRFISAGDGLYNIQFANGNFITSSLTTADNISNAGKYAFYNTNNGEGSYFAWNLNSTSGSRVDNNGAGYTVAFWSSGQQSGTSGNSIWYLYEANIELPQYYVTYTVKDASNNVLFTSEPFGTTQGTTITTLPDDFQLKGFYDYNAVNVTINQPGTTNVVFTATPKAEPLLKYTTDAESPYYYNLNIRSKYLVYNAEATGEVTLQSESEPFNDNASWAFIGTPYGGFKIINKTKTKDYVLTYTSVVTGSNHGNNNIQFVAAADAADKYWYIYTNSNGFVLRMKENPSIYFHHDNSNNFLRTCSTTEYNPVHNDAGSTIVAATDEGLLFALYDELKDLSFGSDIGQFPLDNFTPEEVAEAIETVGTAIADENTSAYGDLYKKLYTIKNNIGPLNTPAAGFYRVKNVATDKYLTITDPTTGYNNTEVKGVYANGDANSAATIIKLADKDGDGHLYMYNQGYGFGWVDANKVTGSGNVWAQTPPDKYIHWFPSNVSEGGQLAFAICVGNGVDPYAHYLTRGIYTADTDESVIGGTNYKADAAQWIFEPYNPADGDVNLDGVADAADITVLIDIIFGKKNPAGYNNADQNGDNSYSISDVTRLVNKIKNAQ